MRIIKTGLLFRSKFFRNNIVMKLTIVHLFLTNHREIHLKIVKSPVRFPSPLLQRRKKNFYQISRLMVVDSGKSVSGVTKSCAYDGCAINPLIGLPAEVVTEFITLCLLN